MYYINVYFSLKYTFNKIKFYKSVFFILKSIACGRYIRGENLKKSLGKTYSLFKLNNHLDVLEDLRVGSHKLLSAKASFSHLLLVVKNQKFSPVSHF